MDFYVAGLLQAAACKLGRIWVNCIQMTNVNYIVQHNDSIEHIGHRHEHPILDHYIRVIDNDNNILVVDKPPSMPVHPCGRYCVHTVLGMLREQRGLRGLRGKCFPQKLCSTTKQISYTVLEHFLIKVGRG